MARTERISYYTDLAEEQQSLSQILRKRIMLVSSLRLALFVLVAVAVYASFNTLWALLAILTVGMILFAQLLVWQQKLSQQKSHADALRKIAEDELKAFSGDYSAFNGATECISPEHDFSFDLDLFGEKSVFQMLNRTSLHIGKEQLCNLMQNPLHDASEIEKRQAAIRELSENPAFCLQFRAIGNTTNDVFGTMKDVENTFTFRSVFKHATLWKILITAIPLFYLAYVALILTNVVSSAYFVMFYLATLGLSCIPIKKTKQIWANFDKKTKTLSKYAQLFQIIEDTSVKSILLSKNQSQLKRHTKASAAVKKLATMGRNLDLAFTYPVALLLNPLFLWNVKYALKIEDWTRKNGIHTHRWFRALSEFDALVSQGMFAFHNPDYLFPEVASGTFCFEATALGHPLISRKKCVKNDVSIVGKPYFMIITGANMAGKSTYLRTIGINHLLASVGMPVCAQTFRFTAGRLLTNLRTADSLVNNESYFFAELKRLKMIIDRLHAQEEGLFIILDEILKGTNSEDKQKGSFALMRRFVKLGGNGIIATHDLALGELETEFPKSVKNYHFDAAISNDTLSFTYQIHKGIARNMNAGFLMKKMGIVE